MNGLLEIQTTQKWLIDYDFGLRAMRLVNAMANGHLIPNADEKDYGYRCDVLPNGEFAARAESDGGYDGEVDEPFINVLRLEGPITREGGACTYGSRQLRDMMMEAADSDSCIGHLLLINGPGGVSTAIPDMQQAVDYARAKGQPIVGRIDGYCASAHCWIAAMCDEVYYNNPTDQIGSIGIYWAGITSKDGDTDPQTGGTWHIVYDPESYDKNRFVRDLADNNDDKLITEELKKDGEIFRNFIKERRPKVKDEHLHGKMFAVKDVEGIMVVGQATMQEVFSRIVELKGKQSKTRTGARAAANANTNMSNINNEINMKEKFPKVFALLGVEEMECNEEGSFFNAGLLQTLEGKIAEMQSANAEAKALAEQLTAEKQTMADEHAAALEEKQNQIAALEQEKADLNTQVETLQNDNEGLKAQVEQLQADVDGARASLTTAEQTIVERDATIAERDQQIKDLNAQIEELSQDPGAEPQAGASPKNNGESADQPQVAVGRYAYDNSLSYEENMRRKREFENK